MNYTDKLAEARKVLLQAIEIGDRLGSPGAAYLDAALADVQRATETHQEIQTFRAGHSTPEGRE